MTCTRCQSKKLIPEYDDQHRVVGVLCWSCGQRHRGAEAVRHAMAATRDQDYAYPSESRDDLSAPRVLYRALTLEVSKRGGTDPVIRAALSSETPVERSGMFGDRWLEVLEHTRDAIDMSRAQLGLPLLLDHDAGELVGRIVDVRLEADRTLRGTLTFSRSARAQDVKQDVVDGIRQDISIGYQILEVRTIERADVPLEVRCTKWMPMEASLVPVPADPTVGVGRTVSGVVRVDPRVCGPECAERRAKLLELYAEQAAQGPRMARLLEFYRRYGA